jgi:tetrahydromethanopterin S-methyltransferase subunit G
VETLKERDQVESWNDDRLDELSGRVDDGFKAVDQRFNRVEQEVKDGFAKVDREMKAGFAKIDERFEKVEGKVTAGFKAVADRFEKTPTRQEMNKGFAEQRADSAALKRTLINGAIAIVVVAIVSASAAIVAALIGFVA